MIFWLYRALWWLLLPLITLFRFYKDYRSPLGLKNFGERFGIGNFLGDCPQADILVHAVSLGEVRAVTPLVEQLLVQYPHKKIHFTATTLTGSQQIIDTFGDRVTHSFLPLDNGLIMRHFLKKVAPDVILIMETEIWPNFIHQAEKQSIPLYIISACLSDRSFHRYQKINKTIHSLLSSVHVLAQTNEDVARFRALGVASAERMGNIKFEQSIPKTHQEALTQFNHEIENHIIWIFASSHEGEEAIALTAYQKARKALPDNFHLILVPRHPERFADVEAMIVERGLSYQKRSITELHQLSMDVDVWLIDTIGELLTFYAIADIVTVAGSFVPIGGHNILEPAYFGKPIMVGPYMDENQEILDLFLAKKAINSTTDVNLADDLIYLYHNKVEREALGENAKATMMANQGGIAIISEAIDQYIR